MKDEQRALADALWLDLVEKSDRTSPEDQPDMALITFAELSDYIATARAEERERCARVAERDGSSHDTLDPPRPGWAHDTYIAVKTADRIATAIRTAGDAP